MITLLLMAKRQSIGALINLEVDANLACLQAPKELAFSLAQAILACATRR